jgi:hypothetical protein
MGGCPINTCPLSLNDDPANGELIKSSATFINDKRFVGVYTLFTLVSKYENGALFQLDPRAMLQSLLNPFGVLNQADICK